MYRRKIFWFFIALIFLYCWIKFYSFYEEGGQGYLGSRQKGDFFFWIELIFVHFAILAAFATSIYLSIRLFDQLCDKKSIKLLASLALFAFASINGVFSYYENESIFYYLQLYYEDWDFFSDNFLMENLVLFFVSGGLLLYNIVVGLIKNSKTINHS